VTWALFPDRGFRPRAALGLLVLAVAAAYANALSGGFQFDDFNVIVHAPAVHGLGAWFRDLGGIRPLLKGTYTLNWLLGPGAFGFHLVNVVLHAANACLVFELGRRWTARFLPNENEGSAMALTLALLFALHPVQTEAVTYVCGRSVSLMTCLYLGSLLAYIRGREEDSRLLRAGLSPCLFLLAALTRETALTLPAALALWEAVGTKGSWRRALRGPLVHWALLGILGTGLALHAGYSRFLTSAFQARGLREQLLGQLEAHRYLASRLLWPATLNIDPGLRSPGHWDLGLLVTAAILLGLVAFALRSLRKRPAFAFGILWYFLQLLPTNSLVPRLDLVNERQLYLASLGPLLLLLAVLTPRLPRRALQLGTAALAVVLGLGTVARNQDYRTEIRLWESSGRANPANPRAHNNLAFALAASGAQAKAREALLRALDLDPEYAKARQNLAALEAGVLPRD